MVNVKKEMQEFIKNFEGMPDRLLKYNEILLEGADASPFCYQDTLSYRRLAVALTTKCNLSCKWCYRLDKHYKDILGKELDIDIYKKFVENTTGKFRLVHFGGLGEPTMYPYIEKAFKYSKKLSDNIKLTTNGTLLTQEKINKYVELGLTHIEISIDAFTKEKLIKYRGVDLKMLYNIVSYISEKTDLFLQINSVVSSENYEDLRNIVSVFKGIKNIKVMHTIPLFVTRNMQKEGIMPLDDEKYKTFLHNLEGDIRRNSLDWKLYPNFSGVKFDPVIGMKKRRNICFSCFEDPYISVTGRFNFCSRQEYSSVVDISQGFEASWNHPELLAFRKNMLKNIYPKYCGELCFLKEI